MASPISRRRFLAHTATNSLFIGLLSPRLVRSAQPEPSTGPESRGVDFHVHLDNSTIDKVLELSRERGLKFGIVEHAGTEENQ